MTQRIFAVLVVFFLLTSILLFNSTITSGKSEILFLSGKERPIEISLYDISGRKKTTLFKGYIEKGKSTISINLDNYPSGIYFVRISEKDISRILKLTVLK